MLWLFLVWKLIMEIISTLTGSNLAIFLAKKSSFNLRFLKLINWNKCFCLMCLACLANAWHGITFSRSWNEFTFILVVIYFMMIIMHWLGIFNSYLLCNCFLYWKWFLEPREFGLQSKISLSMNRTDYDITLSMLDGRMR